MSLYLSSLLDAERQAACARHDDEDRALDARLLHRIPAPNQGRGSEACRRASCAALGLHPDTPLRILRACQQVAQSPAVRFAAAIVGSAVAGFLITMGPQL